ncbi:flotillin-like protein FloA [Gimesia panareensis]|uniref:Flotillin-like protein FloA n=1 Tax=Gimesia panareensis TaxID=2527978 RepID=A0A517QES5_9PLAN|nr:flotillin-like protein FloA [Gimesia panareensis]QDT30146.1 SigmaW regulon antibacterial [Gimesia panareensis]QDU53235.1 SigmaW regulon antibacterial [Gimesia panareensis]
MSTLNLLAADNTSTLIWIAGIVVFLVVLFVGALFARFAGLWIQCKLTNAKIGFFNLLMMTLRKVNPTIIVRSKIMAIQAGITKSYDISTRDLEAHYLAGGNVPNVIRALIAAQRAKIDLDWQSAQAIDLAGRDILDAVRTSVYPKVIDCPDPRKTNSTLDAVAGDGIQLNVRARVTVRTNLKQLVGGATEETVIARVGQGIVQAIGSTATYEQVLENPDKITQIVLNEGLEKQTAYTIVSIDIADIDVGENIGARLQADHAEAEMRVAQAKAEQRRAEQKAREQEMVALTQENRAQVVLAEAKVPEAIADAFRTGKIGILDYYELKNVQADTKMRDMIGTPERESTASN